MSRIFTTADELEDYLHACNESGLDPVTAVLDAGGMVWMTYGEEHTHGGEAMECGLAYGEPNDTNRGSASCEECAAPLDERGNLLRGVPLTRATFPVYLLHDLLEAHWSQRCSVCGHRLDHHAGQFVNGIGVCQPKPLSEAPLEDCDCGGYRRAS